MIFQKWWNRGMNPFAETANLLALSILVVASFLTVDLDLFWRGVAVEAGYLVLASLPTRYRRWRLAALERSFERGEYALDRVLLVVTVAGFAVILFCGFGKHLLKRRLLDLSHAQGWEAGAIIWTGLFLIYYFFKYQATGRSKIDKTVIAVILIADTVLLYWAWKTMHKPHEPKEHVLAVAGIGACLLVIDWLNGKFHIIPRERKRSMESLCWADIPIMVAVSVLYIYLLYLDRYPDTASPEVFVSGVISCQLLMSNATFVVTEFGWLGSPPPTPRKGPGTQSSLEITIEEPVVLPVVLSRSEAPRSRPPEPPVKPRNELVRPAIPADGERG